MNDELLLFELKRKLKRKEEEARFYQSHRDKLLSRINHLKEMLKTSVRKIEGAKRFGEDQMRKKIYLYLKEKEENKLAEEIRWIGISKKAKEEEIQTRWEKTIYFHSNEKIIEDRQRYYEKFFGIQ